MQERVSVSFAGSESDLASARAIREVAYRARLGLDPRSWRDEELRDTEGYVPVLRANGVPVATARVLPISSPYVELRALGCLPTWAERRRELCEISRVATSRKNHGGVPYSTLLFLLGIRWLFDRTDLRRYIAAVRVSLFPFHESFGAQEVGNRFTIPGRGAAQYVVVTGDLTRAVDVAARTVAPQVDTSDNSVSVQV